MPDDIRDELIIHQRENELHFLASAFTMPDAVIHDCAWLRPDMLVDTDIAGFWEQLLSHRDPMRAANNLGIMGKIAGAMAETINTGFYEEYARAIGEDYFLTNVVERLGQIAKYASERNMMQVYGILDEIRNSTMLGFRAGLTADEAGRKFENFIDRLERGDRLAILSGIPKLDKEIGGFFMGEFTTLASRPGHGKTAIMLQIARNVCLHDTVALFSMEMKTEQVWARMACPYAGLDWTNVRIGNVSKEDLRRLRDASRQLREKYAKNLIIIDDVFNHTGIHQVCAQLRPSLVLIDQLAEFLWHDPNESKVSYYGKIIKYLRHYVAIGLDVPIIMNHQINRAVEGRDDKHPQIADLRDSGEIEQRSDVVLLAYRRDLYDGRGPEQWDVPFELDVAKNRQGNMGGCAVLNYNLKEQWFT